MRHAWAKGSEGGVEAMQRPLRMERFAEDVDPAIFASSGWHSRQRGKSP